MRIATAAYPMEPLADWASYAAKITDWSTRAREGGADLAVFPEYGAMELATLAGAETAADLEASLYAVSERIADADSLHADLATKLGLHVLAASAPVFADALGDRPVNRARLFAPQGGVGVQDKQIMTRFEREDWGVAPGGPLRVFDTALGRVGVLICYDAEYPLLGRALSEAEVLLVPSCTEALSGYWRVRIGAMARALEQQCVTVMSSTSGECPWSEAVDTNTGAGGVFGPPDTGFPATGVLALGDHDRPGWTFCDIDAGKIDAVREGGVVLNRSHWDDQAGRDETAPMLRLR